MSGWIVKYEPLCEIITFSKKKYYIKAKNRETLEEMLETKKFVKFWTATVNIASIDTIDEANPVDNFLQAELQKYWFTDQNKIKKEIKLWKSRTHNELTPSVLTQIIETYIEKND